MEPVRRILTEDKINKLKKNQSTTDVSGLQCKEISYDKQCKYGLCDGHGSIVTFDEMGFMIAGHCKCRLEEMQAERVSFAQIPQEFIGVTVKSFQIDCYKKQESKGLATVAKKIATNYVKNFEEIKEDGHGLYFYSDVKGSGKSRIAVSVANELMQGKIGKTRYVTTLDLFAEIRSTFDKDAEKNEDDIMREMKQVDLLILDDVGVDKKVSDWANGILYQIIDYRMVKKKVTIFTSNVPVNQLNYDERTVSRIENMAMQIKMPEESVRSDIAKNKNVEMMKRLMRD